MIARTGWRLALAGLVLLVAGAALAWAVQTAGGTQVRDIRFRGADGTVMSALLYVPAGATAAAAAPGILAVHGYINSRETQDGFAIEFSRRGYVVLALDQTGHGYSGGKAFANGFGGPDGLRYLRSLPYVDRDRIGLEGHSMGGWAVLAAAAALPDAYRSIVLVGSSTGAPFAKDGTPTWPRNLALVFSRYDEFSKLMWGVDRAADVGDSAKLKAVFGATERIAPDRLYGDIGRGDARLLRQPVTTHPGDHASTAAIGDAIDWFARTVPGGHPVATQIWPAKEAGTALALAGFVTLLLGLLDVLLGLTPFASLRRAPTAAAAARDRRWRIRAALGSAVPALLLFPAFIAVTLFVPPSAILPQTVTTQVALWALLGAGLSLLIARGRDAGAADWPRALGLALATLAAGYAVFWVVATAFTIDFRLWVVALKLPGARHWGIALIYVVPLTLAFLATARSLARQTVQGDGAIRQYGSAILTLTGGIAALLAVDYGLLFATGLLPTAFDPLTTVIALQFVPVLAAVAVIDTFTWRRTGDWRVGGLLTGLLVTLYVVAGTATQG